MTPNTALDRLALQDVLLNYAAGVDDRDRERYRACFTEDVEVVGFGTGIYHGRDTWVNYVWEALDRYSSTQHLLGAPLADVDGDTASARTDVQAMHVLPDESRFTLWATYLTEFRRMGDRWAICRHELVVRGTSTD